MDTKVSSSFTFQESTADASSSVLVASNIWRSLGLFDESEELADGPVYISVQPLHSAPHSSQALESICCWASEDAQVGRHPLPRTRMLRVRL